MRNMLRKHPIRRKQLRRRRHIARRWHMARWGRWLILDSATYLLIGTLMLKIREDDIHRIENHTGQNIDTLSERELIATINALGIERQQATPQENRELAPVATNDVIELIKELKQLHDRGILTTEEFESAKIKLLRSL